MFKQLLTEVSAVEGDSIQRAILGGAVTDRLGLAFIAGYSAAITVLDPTITELGALCATEAGGGHPRAILTTLNDGVLNGTKGFVSGGRLAKQLLVVAKVGDVDGRPALKVARIRADAPGVEHADGLELDFIPEVPHGSVVFTNARVDAVLEGDGYERYLKPFRTIEDLHVFGAVLGCLVHNGRSALARETVESLLAQLAAIVTLARQDARDIGTHIALAGVIASSRLLVDSLDLKVFDAEFRTRFERDRKLLSIASKVREARRTKAWSEVG